jgi:[acyl-carrier-protein] S-malonyltransferase
VEDPGWSLVERAGVVLDVDVERLLLDDGAAALDGIRSAQLATYLVSLLAWQAASPLDVAVVAGYSLGELTALVAAGTLAVEEGLALVDARGRALSAAVAETPGAMAAVVGLDPASVERVCAGIEGVWLAAEDAPEQVVVSGTTEAVTAAATALREAGARRVLPVPGGGPLHTPLVGSAVPDWEAVLQAVSYADPAVPVLSAVDGRAYGPDVPGVLRRQLTGPVRWRQVVESFPALGVDTVIELGPGSDLADLARRTVPDLRVISVAVPDDLGQLEGLVSR